MPQKESVLTWQSLNSTSRSLCTSGKENLVPGELTQHIVEVGQGLGALVMLEIGGAVIPCYTTTVYFLFLGRGPNHSGGHHGAGNCHKAN